MLNQASFDFLKCSMLHVHETRYNPTAIGTRFLRTSNLGIIIKLARPIPTRLVPNFCSSLHDMYTLH